jgi:hypothetical protein
MKRLFRLSLVMAILLLTVVIVQGADILRPTGFEVITIDSTAGGKYFTVSKYYASNKITSDYVIMVNETAQIRFTVDGTAPTSTVGTPLQVNQGWVLETYEELKNFRAIRTGTTSGSLNVIYYKRYRQ